MLDHPMDGAALGALPWSVLFQRLAAEGERMQKSESVLVSVGAMSSLRFARTAAAAEATLRALSVAMVMIGDGPNGAKTQAALASPALRDPFGDAPLLVEPRPGGGLRVRSREANERDGNGGSVDVPAAP
jgi:hypothetical protein